MKKLSLVLAICLPVSLCTTHLFASEQEAELQIEAPSQEELLEEVKAIEIEQSKVDFKAQQHKDAQLFIDTIGSMQTMSAQFEQLITGQTGRAPRAASGMLKIKKPGMYAWIETQPYEIYDISNGVKIWKYDVDLEEVEIEFVNERSKQIIQFFEVKQTDKFLEQYEITADRYADETVFTLVPLETNADLSHIYLSFIDDKLNSIRMQTALGQSTLIDFNSVIINEPISDSQFELSIPQDVDVYDNTLFGPN